MKKGGIDSQAATLNCWILATAKALMGGTSGDRVVMSQVLHCGGNFGKIVQNLIGVRDNVKGEIDVELLARSLTFASANCTSLSLRLHKQGRSMRISEVAWPVKL